MKKKFLGVALALALLGLIAMPVAAIAPPYFDVDPSDFDCEPDGEVTLDDYAVMYALWEEEGYDRQWDSDFDDDLDEDDLLYFIATYYAVDDLQTILERVKTPNYTTLTWEEFDDWSCLLYGVAYAYMPDFIGSDSQQGWLHIHRHVVYPGGGYVCHSSSLDTMIASYKALGYGAILSAFSGTHAYNIMCVDVNAWDNLYKWRILKPQTGEIFNAATVGDSSYETDYILFPDYRSGSTLYSKCLYVDYDEKTVYYGDVGFEMQSGLGNCEESCPATFTRFLGQGDD